MGSHAEAAVGVERQGIPISCAAGAVDRRLPHSRAIFLSFFPSTVCHICQSNDDQLRLTPILRLINTLLLSGLVTDDTSAFVLFHVVFMLATHYLTSAYITVCCFQLTLAEQTHLHSIPESQWGGGGTGVCFLPAALGLLQDGGSGSRPGCCPERDGPTPP